MGFAKEDKDKEFVCRQCSTFLDDEELKKGDCPDCKSDEFLYMNNEFEEEDEDEFEVECNECSWQGYTGDLEAKTASLDDCKFIYCPDCQSEDIQDIE